ncbi:hypothetical protein QQ045_010056 [Rhodiola kirilowii]
MKPVTPQRHGPLSRPVLAHYIICWKLVESKSRAIFSNMEREEQVKSRVVRIKSEESWSQLQDQAINQASPVVVHFTASWCMPSVAMNPFVEELAVSYPDVLFLVVDVDEVKVG